MTSRDCNLYSWSWKGIALRVLSLYGYECARSTIPKQKCAYGVWRIGHVANTFVPRYHYDSEDVTNMVIIPKCTTAIVPSSIISKRANSRKNMAIQTLIQHLSLFVFAIECFSLEHYFIFLNKCIDNYFYY